MIKRMRIYLKSKQDENDRNNYFSIKYDFH